MARPTSRTLQTRGLSESVGDHSGEGCRPLRVVDEEQHRVEQLELEDQGRAVSARDDVHPCVGRGTEEAFGHGECVGGDLKMLYRGRGGSRHLVVDEMFERSDTPANHWI